MEKFSQEDWDLLQDELHQEILGPKIGQLERINIRDILGMIPRGETWMVCLGRFRVRWRSNEEFDSWWGNKVIWWIGRVEDMRGEEEAIEEWKPLADGEHGEGESAVKIDRKEVAFKQWQHDQNGNPQLDWVWFELPDNCRLCKLTALIGKETKKE